MKQPWPHKAFWFPKVIFQIMFSVYLFPLKHLILYDFLNALLSNVVKVLVIHVNYYSHVFFFFIHICNLSYIHPDHALTLYIYQWLLYFDAIFIYISGFMVFCLIVEPYFCIYSDEWGSTINCTFSSCNYYMCFMSSGTTIPTPPTQSYPASTTIPTPPGKIFILYQSDLLPYFFLQLFSPIFVS